MKYRIKHFVVFLILISMTLVASSCFNRKLVISKQTEYHESICEIEEYVLNYLGDYVAFNEPRIDYEEKSIHIDVIFLTSYVNDDQKDKSYVEVMEEFRIRFNEYLNSNPDYFLNDGYFMRIYIERAPTYRITSLPYETYGEMTNKLCSSEGVESILCYVNYEYIIGLYDCSNLSFEGVREINFEHYIDLDSELSILEHMQDVEVVHAYSELIPELSHERPDIQFV